MTASWGAVRPYLFGAVLGAIIAAIAVLIGIRPPPAVPVTTSSTAIAKLQSAVQALIAADRLRGTSTATSIPLTAAPAVRIVEKVFPGLTAGQIESILAASRAPTVTTIAATSKLIGPTPAPIPTSCPGCALDIPTLIAADKVAVTQVLADPATHIATTVTISQEEVPPSRLGSSFGADGSGLTYAIIRRGTVDLDLGAVARGAHVSPSIGISWRPPHTSLAIGPRLLYDHGLRVGPSVVVLFGP